jgi:S1-C subfamily serine protease
MHRKTRILALSIVALLILASSAAFDLDPHPGFAIDSLSSSAARGPVASALAGAQGPGPSPSYCAITQQVSPAVVGVTLAGLSPSGPDDAPADLSDPFLRFFGGLPGFNFHQAGLVPGGKLASLGQGSGVIISADGLILTNAHLVREARAVVVRRNDRREFKAKVMGADTWTDIAVFRVDASQLPALHVGDAQPVQLGDPVLAMGLPSNCEPTVSHGIVSGLGRTLSGDMIALKVWREYGFLDAAAKLGQADDAVRSDTAADLEVTPGQLGLSLRPLRRDEKVKAHLQGGLLVESVTGPLARARPMPGDVMLAILGSPLNSVEQFRSLQAHLPNKVALLILRDGERRYVSAELG